MFRRSKVEPLSGVQTKSSKTIPNPAQRIPSASGGASASSGSPAAADCARSRTSLRCKNVGDEEYDSSIETDCGWAYVVLVVSFMIHFIIDGVTLSYGVFYVALSESFPDDTAFKLQMVGSVMMGLYMLVGPFVSGFSHLFGCRAMTITGSIISSTAIAVGSLAPSVNILLCTYSLFGGIGFGMMYLPAIVMITFYFKKRRALATAITVCGTSVGMFVVAPITHHLMEYYGWRGANLIIAGFSLNGVACGLCYRPMKSAPETHGTLFLSRRERAVVAAERRRKENEISGIPVAGISSDNDNDHAANQRRCASLSNTFREITDMSPFRDVTFVVLNIGTIIAFLGVYTPFAVIGDHSIREIGATQEQAALLLTLLGIANTVGRVVSGYLSDLPNFDCILLHNVSLIVSGVVTCLVPFINGLALMSLYLIVFGAAIAVFISIKSIIIVDLFGLHDMTNKFGLTLLFDGIVTIAGAPISGALKDRTGSYNAAFIFAGLLLVLGGLILLPIRTIKRWSINRRQLSENNAEPLERS